MMWTVHIDGGPRRVNHAAVSVGDKIYSFGGHNSTEVYKESDPISVHMLNTSNLRWCKVLYKQSNVPCHRYGHTTVAYGQMVYMWGGRNDSGAFEKICCFNTDTLEWSLPAVSGSVPLAKDGHSACVIRNKMYIFGGFEYATNEYSNELHCLNLDTFVWTYFNISNEAPSPRDFHTAVAYGDNMYVFGGRSKPVSFNSVDEEYYCSHPYCFDTITQKWMDLDNNIQSPPEGRRSHSAWVYKDYMYIFGGYNGTLRQHFNNLSRYSFQDGIWETVSDIQGPIPCERRRQACVLYDDKVYLFGGTSPVPDIGPSDSDSRGVIRDVLEIFNDVIQGDRDVRRLQDHIEMAEDIILPVVNELPLRVRNAIEMDINDPALQEGNDNQRIHNGLDRFINIRLRINGVIDRLNNQIAERNMQNHLNIAHNNRVYRVIRGGGALEEFQRLQQDQNPMNAEDIEDEIGDDDIQELPHFEDFTDPERGLYDNNDLHVLDYSPTLKTLSALVVMENKIDQSCLPQTLVADLQFMTMPNNISKPTDYNEETSE